ncbi:hypothetical protein WJX73_005288 [Symbiochloris irregularis]|uniref:F-box domain-containing protein n=1 Tax=Symbiochloris irregularis TaxID=706552 RepID=A0AAW1P2R4_9CHLO
MSGKRSGLADTGSQVRRQPLLSSGELQQIFTWNVLPRLGLRDFAAISCTCSLLRDLIYHQDEAWLREECDDFLPSSPNLGI